MLLLWVIVSNFFTYAPVIVICNEYFESFIIFAIVIGIFTAIYKFLYMLPVVGDITFWGLWIWGLNIVLAHYKKGFIVAYVVVFIIAGIFRILIIIDSLINALRNKKSKKKQTSGIQENTVNEEKLPIKVDPIDPYKSIYWDCPSDLTPEEEKMYFEEAKERGLTIKQVIELKRIEEECANK